MNKNTLTPLLILLFSALFMFACDDSEEENPDLVSIEYKLTTQEAGKLADIEYTSGFGLILLEDVPLPWSISFDAIFKIGDELVFNAESGDQGEMSAQIIVDDDVLASETAKYIIQISYIKGFK
ncbi:MAG: hypothetical protein GY790_00150 [Bacteroidetes bacterium]|nr:hypothetical protein [Bacteroidota bacterium]